MKLSLKLSIILLSAIAGSSSSASASTEADVTQLSRRCGPATYSVAEAIYTNFTGGYQDNCDPTNSDIAAFCRVMGNRSADFQQRCFMIQSTQPAIDTRPSGNQEYCPENLLGRNGEIASSLRQNINAFYGDENLGTSGTNLPLRAQFFNDCPQLNSNASDFLEMDTSTASTAACMSMVSLRCGSRVLNGFHLVKTSSSPARYRIYSAAHVLNSYNRDLLGSSGEPGIYGFNNCQVIFPNGGPNLSGTTIGSPNFRTAAVRSAVEGRNTTSFSQSPSLAQNDIAWFELEPGENSEILEKAALVQYRGNMSALSTARVCSVGHYGRSNPVNRCVRHGARIGDDGRIQTRTPTVRGMSGGAYVASVNGQNYAIGVVTSEWGGQTGSDSLGEQLSGTNGSQVLEYVPGRDNLGVRY